MAVKKMKITREQEQSICIDTYSVGYLLKTLDSMKK